MGARVQGFLHLHKSEEGVQFSALRSHVGSPAEALSLWNTIKLIQSIHLDMRSRICLEGSCLKAEKMVQVYQQTSNDFGLTVSMHPKNETYGDWKASGGK